MQPRHADIYDEFEDDRLGIETGTELSFNDAGDPAIRGKTRPAPSNPILRAGISTPGAAAIAFVLGIVACIAFGGVR